MREAVKGLANKAAHRGRGQARPITREEFAAIVAHARRGDPRKVGRHTETAATAKARGDMDAAIAGVLFQAGLRRSEAAALEWRDVAPASIPGAVTITVRQSKTNRDGSETDIRLVKNGAAAALSAIRPDGVEPTAKVFGGLTGHCQGSQSGDVPRPLQYKEHEYMIRIALIATLVVCLTAACKMNLTTDVYSTDLWDTAVGSEGLTAPATMAFEVPGTDDCDEHTAEISEIMSGVVNEFNPRGCERDGMESFLLADTQVPILDSFSAWDSSDALFGIVVTEIEDAISADMFMNLDKYGLLTERMNDKFHQSVDLATSAVIIVLNNDSRGSIEFSVNGVFVNGEPVLTQSTFQLERRHKAEIKFSNVATAYLAKHGSLGGVVLRQKY